MQVRVSSQRNAELVEQSGEHLEDFCVAEWRFTACRLRTDHFSADLPELPVAALLGALTAELRANVIELLQLAALAELVFDVGPDYSGGVFGAEG